MKISFSQILIALLRLEVMSKKSGSWLEENYLFEQIKNNPDLTVTHRAFRSGMTKLEGNTCEI